MSGNQGCTCGQRICEQNNDGSSRNRYQEARVATELADMKTQKLPHDIEIPLPPRTTWHLGSVLKEENRVCVYEHLDRLIAWTALGDEFYNKPSIREIKLDGGPNVLDTLLKTILDKPIRVKFHPRSMRTLSSESAKQLHFSQEANILKSSPISTFKFTSWRRGSYVLLWGT